MTRALTHGIEWLRRHYLWLFPLATAGLVAFVGWWGHARVRDALQKQLKSDLQATINANVTALEIWVSDQKRLASTLARDPELVPLARTLLQLKSTNAPASGPANERPDPASFRERAQLSAKVAEVLNRRLVGTGYKVGQIVDTNLSVLAESGMGRRRGRGPNSVPESLQPKFQELFKTGEPVMITPFKPPRPTRFQRGRGPGGGPGFAMDTNRFNGRGGPFAGDTNAPNGFGFPRREPPPMEAGLAAGPGPGPGAGMGPGPDDGPGARGGGPNFGPGGPGERRGGPGGGFGSGPGFGPGAMNPTNRNGAGFPREISALMQVAAPILDAEGRTLGALGLILDPEEEFTRILSVARPGDSGETYAFDRHGVLISRSRFESELRRLALIDPEGKGGSALTLELREPGADFKPGTRPGASATNWPLTHLVNAAIEGVPGTHLEPTRDYRGVPVVGTWRWLPHLGFGVVTQLDESEAYLAAGQLQQVFIVLILLLSLTSIGLLMISNAGIRWRKRMGEAELRARTLGQYTLMEKIGEGGMGVVYKARHALMRRETAVKLLLPEHADDATVARFEKEVRLTCRLKHPCTIQVFDYGRTFDGIFYYAMEYLEGLTLQRLVETHGALPQSRVIHILIQVCDSLAEAHALGLVHRDIKPANIYLCCQGGMADLVKVLDFGLVGGAAASEADEEGVPDRHAGTPQYMAPEAFSADTTPEPRIDLYALGATAYFLLTGREVFSGPSVEDLRKQHQQEEPASLSQLAKQAVDPRLEALILDCLKKDPTGRPASAPEVAHRLRAIQPSMLWTQEDSRAWWNAHDSGALQLRGPDAVRSTHSELGSPETSANPVTPATPTLLIPADSRFRPRG